MTESERKNTLRVLAKRNKARLDVLKAKEEASGASESEHSTSAETNTNPSRRAGEPENQVHDEL